MQLKNKCIKNINLNNKCYVIISKITKCKLSMTFTNKLHKDIILNTRIING